MKKLSVPTVRCINLNAAYFQHAYSFIHNTMDWSPCLFKTKALWA